MRDEDNVVLWVGALQQKFALRLARMGRCAMCPRERSVLDSPLELWEDPKLETGSVDRGERLRAAALGARIGFRRCMPRNNSNGIIDVVEALIPAPSKPATLLDQYKDRKQRLRQVDMIVFAGNHWNFNVRGFNPGGNHGAFFQPSTHAVMLFAGGGETGVPKGLRVEEPYDGLSLVPTLLTLLGKPEADLPGPVIHEVIGGQ